jgi:hypothetical protein
VLVEKEESANAILHHCQSISNLRSIVIGRDTDSVDWDDIIISNHLIIVLTSSPASAAPEKIPVHSFPLVIFYDSTAKKRFEFEALSKKTIEYYLEADPAATPMLQFMEEIQAKQLDKSVNVLDAKQLTRSEKANKEESKPWLNDDSVEAFDKAILMELEKCENCQPLHEEDNSSQLPAKVLFCGREFMDLENVVQSLREHGFTLCRRSYQDQEVVFDDSSCMIVDHLSCPESTARFEQRLIRTALSFKTIVTVVLRNAPEVSSKEDAISVARWMVLVESLTPSVEVIVAFAWGWKELVQLIDKYAHYFSSVHPTKVTLGYFFSIGVQHLPPAAINRSQ